MQSYASHPCALCNLGSLGIPSRRRFCRDLRPHGVVYCLLLTTGCGGATALIDQGTRLGDILYLPACEGVSRVLVP